MKSTPSMLLLIWIVSFTNSILVAQSIQDSGNAVESTVAVTEPELFVRCQLLLGNPSFLSQFGIELTPERNDQFVMTDIESFFLFSDRGRKRSAWNRYSPGNTLSIYDNVTPDEKDYCVDVSFIANDDPSHDTLEISATDKSRFRLDSTKTIKIPINGSVMLRTAEPPQNGKTVYLWIGTRRDIETESD